MKMTHRILYQKNKDGVWYTYDTWSESDARSTGNRLWIEGYYRIQMFIRTRSGWSLLKDVKQSERVAQAKQRAHLQALAEQAGASIDFI